MIESVFKRLDRQLAAIARDAARRRRLAGNGDTAPVVFLDVDGVLNSPGFFGGNQWRRDSERGRKRGSLAQPRGAVVPHLDPRAVKLLQRLVSASGAVVVIHSTRRTTKDAARIVPALRSTGFAGTIAGMTDPKLEAAASVRAWLAKHRRAGAPYVVLDDYDGYGFDERHFVWVDRENGLTAADVREALAILRRSR